MIRLSRKVLLTLFFMLIIFTGVAYSVDASDFVPVPRWDNPNLNIKYRSTNIDVMMPSEYIAKETGFRAVWVTPVTGDIASYSTEQQFKAEMMRVFDTLEYYNMNAMVFHIRTHHDAMYKSNLNRISPRFKDVNFDEFDPIEWLIQESRKRGIEFHAWLNPYRVGGGGTLEQIAATFPAHNPASDVDNLLRGNQNVILDPGRPVVRQFLFDTIKEIIETYDVDAIHFDDYFYENGIDDFKTRQLYNKEGLSVEEFRRKQVDLLIEGIHEIIEEHNLKNKKYVQFGISPTGIYRNGSYVPKENHTYFNGRLTHPVGSNTSGYSHYGAPLYADTLKWAYEEWIDYIVPQVYYAFDQPAAQFADVVEWWAAALKYSKVNLYIGTALYKIAESNSYGWTHNLNEMAHQVQYSSAIDEVRGQVIFSFSQLYDSLRVGSQKAYQNMHRVKDNMWTTDVLLPEVRTMHPKKLKAVTNLEIFRTSKGFRLDFDAQEDAKTYAIYRSKTPLNFDESEIIKVLGKVEVDGKVSYIDEVSTSENYYYGVAAISRTNTKGHTAVVTTDSAKPGDLLPAVNVPEIYYSPNIVKDEIIDLFWEGSFAYFGGEYEYELFTSNDGTNFTKNPFAINKSNHYFTTKVIVGDGDKFYFYLQIKNDLTLDKTDTYVLNIKKDLGTVKGLGVIGDFFAGETVEFVWHAFPYDNVSYKLQTSTDQIAWKDVNGSVKINGSKASLTTKLPNYYTNNYYRVVAENASGVGVSEVLRLEAFIKLPELNLKFNGKDITGPIYVNQGESIEITWDNIEFEGATINYLADASENLELWRVGRYYDNRNGFSIGDEVTSYNVYGSYGYHALFFKIKAVSGNASTKEYIVEVRIIPGSLSTNETLYNYFNYHKALINRTKIFN